MADLKLKCPHCQQPLEAPEEMLGQQIDCPSCSQTIQLPKPSPNQPASPIEPPQKQTRDCPFCGEEILLSAIKCKHCGEFLDGRNRKPDTPVVPPQKNVQPKVEKDVWKGHPSYLYYLAIFIIGVLLIPACGIGLLIILFAILDRNTRVYTLTNKRALAKAGIISRQIHEVGTKDVRNINIKQGVFARLFGVGTVEIESAAAAGQGHVRFVGVKDPLHIRDLIRREKDEADS